MYFRYYIVEAMIDIPPESRAVAELESVTFVCVATGNRPPSITWFRQDGMELTPSESVMIANETLGNTTRNSTLTIMPVTLNDFTVYSCVAENTVADNIIEVITRNNTADFTLYRAGKF